MNSNLEDKLKATVLAAALQEEEVKQTRKMEHSFAWAGAAVAFASLVIFFALPSNPKDTYDDPAVAYAEVEKTFALISSKIEKGSEFAQKADEPIETINKLFK